LGQIHPHQGFALSTVQGGDAVPSDAEHRQIAVLTDQIRHRVLNLGVGVQAGALRLDPRQGRATLTCEGALSGLVQGCWINDRCGQRARLTRRIDLFAGLAGDDLG